MQGDFPSTEDKKAPKKKFSAFSVFVSSIILFLFLIGGALIFFKDSLPNIPIINPKVSVGDMDSFKNYNDLLVFLDENSNSSVSSSYYDYSDSVILEKSISDGNFYNSLSGTSDSINSWGYESAPSGVPTEEVSRDTDYSETNVQVEGVDEGDIVKTDGNYIYMVKKSSSKDVIIVDSDPENPSILSTTTLEYNPSGLYINGDKMAVYGNGRSINYIMDNTEIKTGRNAIYSFLTIYDISDRTNPKEEKEYSFEGSYSQSRMIGDYVYYITTTTPVFAYYDIDRPVPFVLEDGEIMPLPDKPNVHYFNVPYTSQNFTSIASVNLSNPDEEIENSTYVLDGNQNTIYVSSDNIYITFSKYYTEEEILVEVLSDFMSTKLSTSDLEKISEIKKAENYILTEKEKVAKIMDIFERYYYSLETEDRMNLQNEVKDVVENEFDKIAGEMQKTSVHKIEINKGSLDYKTSGEVSGRVLNQFAMDENDDGYFRIATTVDRSWSGSSGSTASYNNLYVLDSKMKQVGEVENIAEGEKIYSVRFMGNRAYMVTFKRVDPLFVIGLEDPKNPEILGELKVPGYSTYLHPYDENLLIGLGINANERGVTTQGVKLSLFDATDVNNPKEIDTYILGGYGSSSTALSEHKAFLFSKEKNLLVIPAVVTESVSENNNRWSYNSEVVSAGSAVFKVDESGFELRELIDHRTESQESSYYYSVKDAKRNIYIGDNLYSISDNYIKVNGLNDLEEVSSLEL